MANEMTYQGAFDHLVNNIYAPVFFEKLANDFGIRPSTEQEAREFLALAGRLQKLDEANQEKQASDRHSLVASANQSLDALLNKAGIPSPAYANNEQEIKQAADALSQLPHIRDAALLYQDAVHQMLAK